MPINSIFMRFPNGLGKALTLSYDDAVEQDVRLIEIMQKHGLCGTFNINSSQYIAEDFVYPPEKKWGQRMTKNKATALYSQKGLEPALHGYTHPHLQTLPAPQVAYETIKDREQLEEQFGHIVRGMAYPFGTYNDQVVQVLRDCGIAYCRTTHATHKFTVPTDWLRLDPTCHHKDTELPALTQAFLDGEVGSGKEPWLFYLWGHSYEFERDHNWEIIEEFAAQIGGKADVWYATNIEIYEYVESFRSLVFSLDQRYVQNPTALPIWFVLRNRLYCVEPGQSIALD